MVDDGNYQSTTTTAAAAAAAVAASAAIGPTTTALLVSSDDDAGERIDIRHSRCLVSHCGRTERETTVLIVFSRQNVREPDEVSSSTHTHTPASETGASH